MERTTRRISVVVLGDLGRSPRMQYHALSLAGGGAEVTLIGLRGEPCLASVQRKVHIREIEDVAWTKSLPWLLRAPMRAVRNAVLLLAALLKDGRSDLILVQNPPAIPTLAVCCFAAWWTGAGLVIDWHNLGFKMLEHGGSSGKSKRVLVSIARTYEKILARMADGHICVTKALSEWLETNFHLPQLKISVVYDRPHEEFRRLSDSERTDLLTRLGEENVLPLQVCEDLVQRKAALVVSGTSWTPDEDFSLFLGGLRVYAKKSGESCPNLVAVITGKGPLRAEFEPKMASMEIETNGRVRVFPAWLSSGDYPLFLGAADLGVSMHTSTSGLDLPMKVVDMFGASLPALAVRFDCIGELVKDNRNGIVFDDETALASGLKTLLGGFPDHCEKLAVMRKNLQRGFDDWQKNWEKTASPALTNVVEKTKTRLRCRALIPFLAGFLALVFILDLIRKSMSNPIIDVRG